MDKDVKSILNLEQLEVKNVTKIPTLSNKLFKLDSVQENLFLKIFTNKNAETTGFKLAQLYPILAAKGIPVPKVIKYDDSRSVINYPYLIITEVEGKMLCQVFESMSENELLDFYYEFGKTLGRIHSITFDSFGETFDGKTVGSYAEIGNLGPFKKWKDLHSELIKYRLGFFMGTYFQDLITPIKTWFANNSHLINYKITPRLLHIDLNQKNVFVKNNKISGIIDFDGAFVGHNEEELMRTEGANFADSTELRDSFLKGYTELIELDEGYEKRRRFYYLSRLLVHIDCLINYGTNYVGDVKKERELMRKEINDILAGKPIEYSRNKRNT